MDFSDPFGNSSENEYPVPNLKDSKRPILITERSESKVLIIDSLSQGVMWEWKVKDYLSPSESAWFASINEAKAIYNTEYVLITSSTGGAALIRVQDKKLVFYTKAGDHGGGPHSAEVLPDGNIVVAVSGVIGTTTGGGSALKIYRVDANNPYVATETKKYDLTFAHNAVWDKEREVLWATDDQNLYTYTYDNSDPNNPELIKNAEFYPVPDSEPHDLFPVYGKEQLYLTTARDIWIFDIASSTFTKNNYSMSSIKSISDGPPDFGVLVIKPTAESWTNRVTNVRGSSAFYDKISYQIYKARWFIENPFSYPENHPYRQSK